jgi:2-polyprenyl-3-methyl-5-hydroxy-6-metoxy-1,4-benzoquinol methylase
MSTRFLLAAAAMCDKAYSLKKAFQERCGMRDPLLREVCRYYHVPEDEGFLLAAHGKERFNAAWHAKKRATHKDYVDFYSETNFYCFRQPWYHRRHAWHAVLFLHRKKGRVLEFGCGMACMSRWLLARDRAMDITLADIPSSTWDYVRRDLQGKVAFAPVEDNLPRLDGTYDIITCNEVLEHVPEPYALVAFLYEHLSRGGFLFIDFIKEQGGPNLAESQAERARTIAFLNGRLYPFSKIDDRTVHGGIYRKP